MVGRCSLPVRVCFSIQRDKGNDEKRFNEKKTMDDVDGNSVRQSKKRSELWTKGTRIGFAIAISINYLVM